MLQSMGWRQGKGVGPSAAADQPQKKGRRWGPEAGVGPENTPIYELAPKTDQHGLGFDPYKVTCNRAAIQTLYVSVCITHQFHQLLCMVVVVPRVD